TPTTRAVPSRAAARWTFSWLRPEITTLAPSATSCSAVANPSPRLAPLRTKTRSRTPRSTEHHPCSRLRFARGPEPCGTPGNTVQPGPWPYHCEPGSRSSGRYRRTAFETVREHRPEPSGPRGETALGGDREAT